MLGARAIGVSIGALALMLVPVAVQAAGQSGMPGFPAMAQAPRGAPNILVVLTDDVGFGAASTFGGGIPTPVLDGLARDGLVYDNFYTTALCSPTRAALLTGRNHHAVGFGEVADFARGLPGYTSVMPKSAATFGRILKDNGYATAWFGKNHNVPSWQAGPLGPFDQWASGLGFDYFYGFHGGMTDQFAPALIENNTMIEPPVKADYIFDRDMADHALAWLGAHRSQSPDKPFLLYYAPGTAHAPLQAPADWIARFKGSFDRGWDSYRSETFARQKRLGLIPAGATLPPMPDNIPAWETLTPQQKTVYARLMEAYAGALAYCDDQIGRVIGSLRQNGELDNTLIIFIQGDNGASAEGGAHGSMNYAGRLAPAEELAYSAAHLDEIGGPRSYPIVPAGWAMALNTPFPLYKVVASSLGGIRNGMVVSWPKGIKQRGLRTQFTHVTDVLPTLLEAANIRLPDSVGGVAQQPLNGVSFAYSFDHAAAASRHQEQYFAILGNAALYKDGWFAGSKLRAGAPGDPLPDMDAPWRLYDLNRDATQSHDLSEDNPQKLAVLRGRFRQVAEQNHVLPMSDKVVQLLLPGNRPEQNAQAGIHRFERSAFRYPEGVFANINNRAWSFSVPIQLGTGGGNGVIVTQGGRFSGWGLIMQGGVPSFLYRLSDHDRDLVRVSGKRLAPGRHDIRVSFQPDGPGLGRGGQFILEVDGKAVGQAKAARTAVAKFGLEDATIGHDSGTALTDDYRIPFDFDGWMGPVTFDLQDAVTEQTIAVMK